eukprot:GFUD01076395.1.p2 GENE.GFUD01076395.1~~GFUD01076395.1.p2  ORF type:complete len:124 (+),score=43.08 GFUD01076395.1:54-425(+)
MGNHHPSTTSLSSVLDTRDMELLGEQTNLTHAEIREQYIKFKGATSGEETINRHIFSQIMHKCYPRTYKFADKLMTEMDTDQDGVISEDELVSAFMRSEHLTTIMVNKIMTRFTSASVSILKD